MENPIEIMQIDCFFCGKQIPIAKIDVAPTLHCSDCYSKHQSGVNISEIKRKRELKENDKRVIQLAFMNK
jgi:ribosome-binding protein aMBF1 (putative translation factor)